jgi:hypothetical protein
LKVPSSPVVEEAEEEAKEEESQGHQDHDQENALAVT